MCLFVRVVDHGVNEGEPIDEQYCEQANEDQFRDPEPEGQYFDQDLSEGFEDGKFNPILWCMFCPSFYKHNLLACFTNCICFACMKTRLDSHPLICDNHSLTT